MLELPALLIRREGGVWHIAEPETGRIVGYARLSMANGFWRICWLASPAWQVFEAEDEPLVFTVQRLWGFFSKWEVCDADGHRIALLRSRRVLDASGRQWTSLVRTPQGNRFPTGDRELASSQASKDTLRLNFAPELHANPLAKMSLLAAILVNGEW